MCDFECKNKLDINGFLFKKGKGLPLISTFSLVGFDAMLPPQENTVVLH